MPRANRLARSSNGISSLTMKFASSLPCRLSMTPWTARIASDTTNSANWTNCSGQRMHRMVPSMSSRSNIAYFEGLPGRGFLVCANLMAESMPPSMASVRCFKPAAATVLWEQ